MDSGQNPESCIFCLKDSVCGYYFAQREFLHCSHCGAVFVSRNALLEPEDERTRYDLHNNSSDNSGYRNYLSKIADDVEKLTDSKSFILDFGCGKNAVLSEILSNRGFSVFPYDPLYSIGTTVREHKFDFIIMCEVIEHIYDFKEVIKLIREVSKESASVYIRTSFLTEEINFEKWWYKEDPTHVNFLTEFSLSFLAKRLNKRIEFFDGKERAILV